MSDLPAFNWSKTAMGAMGIELVEFTPEQVVAVMPVTWKTHTPFGILHGGVSVVIAETVASAGSYLFIDPQRQSAVGLEINANHIKSVASGVVRAVGKPVHVGKKTLVWEIHIYDEQEDLVCISRCTTAVLDKPKTGDSIR
ncbi:coma operon protein 2 [hydrocarbon metagenome]|uniref:Coma operon protein 2 n=1 Tax=hydrocarbon metagenome TaxID=938273 RepID=A0A0W8EA31_9ZZZZ